MKKKKRVYDAITKTVQHYIDGAKSGRGADMKPGFHQDATVRAYRGEGTSRTINFRSV